MGFILVDNKVINLSNEKVIEFTQRKKDEKFIDECRKISNEFNKNK